VPRLVFSQGECRPLYCHSNNNGVGVSKQTPRDGALLAKVPGMDTAENFFKMFLRGVRETGRGRNPHTHKPLAEISSSPTEGRAAPYPPPSPSAHRALSAWHGYPHWLAQSCQFASVKIGVNQALFDANYREISGRCIIRQKKRNHLDMKGKNDTPGGSRSVREAYCGIKFEWFSSRREMCVGTEKSGTPAGIAGHVVPC
jgi:hypothetical protein